MIELKSKMTILWLGEQKCDDPREVGAKIANLSMLSGEFRVPPGFCLTDLLLEQHIATPSHSKLTRIGFATSLLRQIRDAYRKLGKKAGFTIPRVAVRSSLVGEDDRLSSYAGQLSSYLNVRGAKSLETAVKNCLLSASFSSIQLYRRKRRLTSKHLKMSVLVQEFIPAEVSVIAFSKNPIVRGLDELVINACWGLGPSLANGTVTPDTFVVRKSDLRVMSTSIGNKQRMVIPADSHVREVNVSRRLWSLPALSRAQVAEVATLCSDLERRMGQSIDVECAYKADCLYLLQCRPLTGINS